MNVTILKLAWQFHNQRKFCLVYYNSMCMLVSVSQCMRVSVCVHMYAYMVHV